jgi:inner membrane protein involved in colicin E2 resistance
MRSKFLKLNLRDFLKGLLYAVVAAVLTTADQAVLAGAPLDLVLLKKVGLVALATILAYLSANIFQNSEGKFLTKEPK